MSPREWKLRIADMITAIQKVLDYIEGLDLEDFATDDKTMDAVIRNLGIIGEAAVHVPWPMREAHPEIPWRQMTEMRNFVIHVYFGISTKTLWETITGDLPPLIPLLEEVLREE